MVGVSGLSRINLALPAIVLALCGCQITQQRGSLSHDPLQHISQPTDDADAPSQANSSALKIQERKTPTTIRQVNRETEGRTTSQGIDDPISTSLSDRLRLPKSLPGSDVPPLRLPRDDPDHPEKLRKTIDELFPELPKLLRLDQPPETTVGSTSLSELERIAIESHPSIIQARADVDSAVGKMVQAGLRPNPNMGYETDSFGTGTGTGYGFGYQGGLYSQVFKTAGKLDLARSSATMNLYNAQLDLTKAQIAVRSQVRRTFFAVLVAHEQERVADALAQFTHEVYRVQVDQLKGGQAAAYEPMQLRVLATQARAALIQAQNRTDAAYRKLASAVGSYQLPKLPLAGSVHQDGPTIDYEAALARMTEVHTDILSARNSVHRSRIDLRLAEITPIPDVNFYTAIQKDNTTPPFVTVFNMQLSVPVPVFDRNQGGIRNAHGQLVRASQEENRLRNELAFDLAAAFEGYKSNRELVRLYRNQIIPDQSRAYRGVYERHQQEPVAVGFGDIVNAQQTLANVITTYLNSLGDYWTAVVDIAELLQIENLNQPIPSVWMVPIELPPEPNQQPEGNPPPS